MTTTSNTTTSIARKLAANPRAEGAPRQCLELEAMNLLDHVRNLDEWGLNVEDSELERVIDDALFRLERDAVSAQKFKAYSTEP